MITLPDTASLQPVRLPGTDIYLFRSGTTPLLRIDLLFQAGSACQRQPLVASAAARMLVTATSRLDSARLAEYLDFRGIIADPSSDTYQSSLTFYTLSRHADDLMSIIADMLGAPAFSDADLDIWCHRRHAEIAAIEQRSSHLARRHFYQALFGPDHPLGRYATADDPLRLTPDIVRRHIVDHYIGQPHTTVLAGQIEGERLKVKGETLEGERLQVKSESLNSKFEIRNSKLASHSPLSTPIRIPLPQSVQTSLRIGRLLPLTWDHPDYASFLILTTLLGGYFGSRLMSNLREDKGYTYGIYAHTQIYRDSIVFYILADIAAGHADDAVRQVFAELDRLRTQPVSDSELQLVRNVFVGDFLRSVDGVFELSQRFCDMTANRVDERLTDNLRQALASTTPADLQRLAADLLDPASMAVVLAGAL